MRYETLFRIFLKTLAIPKLDKSVSRVEAKILVPLVLGSKHGIPFFPKA